MSELRVGDRVQAGEKKFIVFLCEEECHGFLSTARVSIENGKSVTMSELRLGDRVKTGLWVINKEECCCFLSTAKVPLKTENKIKN